MYGLVGYVEYLSDDMKGENLRQFPTKLIILYVTKHQQQGLRPFIQPRRRHGYGYVTQSIFCRPSISGAGGRGCGGCDLDFGIKSSIDITITSRKLERATGTRSHYIRTLMEKSSTIYHVLTDFRIFSQRTSSTSVRRSPNVTNDLLCTSYR